MKRIFATILVLLGVVFGAEPPTGEASKFLEEAEWALKWDLFPEARSAAEAGWALGLTHHHMASTRMIALARSADERTPGFGMSVPPIPAPEPARLVYLREALTFAADYLRRDERALLDRRVYEALCETLAISGDSLARYYHVAEKRAGNEAMLADIRKECRAILPIFMRHPEVAATGPLPALPEKPLLAKYRGSGFAIAFVAAPLFFEKPEEVVPFYREFLARPAVNNSSVVQQIFVLPIKFLQDRETAYPIFAGWRLEDRLRVYDVEERFGEELLAEDSPAANAIGRWLRRYDPRGDAPGRAKAAVELPPGPSGFGLPPGEKEKLIAAMKARRAGDGKESGKTEIPAAPANAPASAEERAKIEARREEINDLHRMAMAGTREERRKLIAEIEKRRAARGELPAQGPPPPPPPLGPEILPGGTAFSANYWAIPFSKFRSEASAGPASAPRLRNGKIWTQLRYHYSYWAERGDSRIRTASRVPALLEVAPEDWSWKLIPLEAVAPPEREEGFFASRRLTENNFEVTKEAVWLMNSLGLHRFDLKSRQWKTKPLLGEAGDLYLIDGRLICSGESSIYEIKDEGERAELLASCRRRPALSPLDELAAFQRPPLAGADGGLLRAFFKEEAWLMAGAKSRAELHLTEANLSANERGAIYVQWKRSEGSGLVYWVDRAGGPSLIASTEGHPSLIPTNAAPAGTKWLLWTDMVRFGSPMTFEQAPAILYPMQQAPKSSWKIRSLLMLLMEPGAPGPAPVGVELKMDFSAEAEERAPFQSIFNPGPVMETERDLILIPFTAPGFIKFSKDEIKRARASARKP